MMDIQYRRPDGTFVAILNDMPYHVTLDDPLYPVAVEMGTDAPFEPVVEPEPAAPPQEVSRSQARLALLEFGYEIGRPSLLDEADALVSGLQPGGVMGLSALSVRKIKEAWLNSTNVRRDSPSLNLLFPLLGLTLPEQLDRLFVIAATQAV